jgi:ABC-type branched-subunit amino acid transport system substrate-binding protein
MPGRLIAGEGVLGHGSALQLAQPLPDSTQPVLCEVADDHGGEIVTELGYSEGDNDFKAQLTRIRRANPEAIYAPGYYTEVGSICKQARQLGITVPLALLTRADEVIE